MLRKERLARENYSKKEIAGKGANKKTTSI